jgi:hypothetical protein
MNIRFAIALTIGLALSGCGSGNGVGVQSAAAPTTGAVTVSEPHPPKPEPITVMVEKEYYHHEILYGPNPRLVVEVRISKADALRLHDPEGTPKKQAWHLVPELAEGRRRFTLECIPARKDCFTMTPGETYVIELMSQNDPQIPSHNKSFRFVKVNGVGAYLVGDYSYEVN